jgi:hypothetical protein
MGRVFDIHGTDGKCIQIFSRNPEGKILFGISRCIREGNQGRASDVLHRGRRSRGLR